MFNFAVVHTGLRQLAHILVYFVVFILDDTIDRFGFKRGAGLLLALDLLRHPAADEIEVGAPNPL